jgi:hypothetical protein
MCRRMDSRSGSGLNRVPVNKSADILDDWMHALKEIEDTRQPI